jgi:hypothetical protein
VPESINDTGGAIPSLGLSIRLISSLYAVSRRRRFAAIRNAWHCTGMIARLDPAPTAKLFLQRADRADLETVGGTSRNRFMEKKWQAKKP